MPIDTDENLSQAKKLTLALQSADKKARKRALIDLEALISKIPSDDLQPIFTETQIYILNSLRDKAELVREQGIKLVDFFIISKLPINDFYLTYLFPVLIERIGTVELIEESEEIRLALVQLLRSIIAKYAQTAQLKPFLGDCVQILAESLKDKHPSIKELSAACVPELAEALPRDFHLQAEALVKPLVGCLAHQRYRVRVEAVHAIGEVIMHSTYNALNEAVGPLAEKLFDSIPAVRRSVAAVAAKCMLNYRDRYSFFAKILPLLLTGLNDEVEETREEAAALWVQVGKQFEKENEKDLKEQMDFLNETPPFYPEKLKRPNLGCRVLVQRNVGKLAHALSMELTSWQPDVRFRCSQLLVALVLHAEENLTQNMQELLPAMYSAARDEDQRVAENIIRASEIIGVFVPNSTWRKLVLPAIEDGAHWGQLLVLGALIRGAPKDYIHPDLEEITRIIADDAVCMTRKEKNQLALVQIVEAVAEKYIKTENDVGYHLFKVVIVQFSLQTAESALDLSIFDRIYQIFGFDSVHAFWGRYLGRLLIEIGREPAAWTVITPQKCIFDAVLVESGPVFGEYCPKIGEILIEALDTESDAESRLKTFLALDAALENKAQMFAKSEKVVLFFDNLIKGVFVPSLVWKAGRTAEAIRTMAAACLLTALAPVEGVEVADSVDALLPLLLSLLEDASFRSRGLAAELLAVLKAHKVRKGEWGVEDLLKMYPEMLKRLDDPSDAVRLGVLGVLPAIFQDCPEEFKGASFRAHHELIVDTLLTHFDDDDANVQGLVEEVIKVMAGVNKSEVRKKMDRHKSMLRNKEGLERIETFINNMN